MRKPIIAITPKTGNTNQEEQKYCYVFPNFIHCVSACGGIPIQLNNLEGTVSAADVEEILNHVDGVIFSGGPDIHPGLYGEELWTARRTGSRARCAGDSTDAEGNRDEQTGFGCLQRFSGAECGNRRNSVPGHQHPAQEQCQD